MSKYELHDLGCYILVSERCIPRHVEHGLFMLPGVTHHESNRIGCLVIHNSKLQCSENCDLCLLTELILVCSRER